MIMLLHDQSKRFACRFALDFILVPLHKDKECLVPQYWKHAVIIDKVCKMLNQAGNHWRWKGILFVEKRFNENGGGATIFELSQLVNGNCRMMSRNRHSLQHRSYNGCLSQGAILLTKWKQNALEKRSWFVNTLFERHVIMIIQLLVGNDISSDTIQQDKIVESLSHFRIEVGGKDSSGGVHCLWAPNVRSSQIQDFFPICKRRNDFESLWKLTRGIPT
mmetsp:Transcript_32581/g.58975  ORF Transcript_32581/g.58975 Transcript_32581/m.58975 type:complete len:219 (+) Transcript_32581:939-1595(+)